MDKTLIPATKHSKHLLEAITKASAGRQDVQEVLEAGKWYVKSGEAILGGPSEKQWDAWMEAAYGPSRTK
jgi:hypothetical protein